MIRRLWLVAAWLWLAAPAGATTFFVTKAGSDGNTCLQAQAQGTARLTIAGGIGCLSGGGDTLLVGAGTYVENVNSGVPSGSSWSSYVRIAAIVPGTSTLAPASGFYAVSFTANESYIEWDGINIDAGNVGRDNWRVESWASGFPHHIRLKNATLYGSLQNTGDISAQPQMVLLSNTVGGRSGNNEVINCTFLRGGGNQDFAHAIYVSSEANLIDGNNISQFRGAGIQVYHSGSPSPDNNVVRNNIVHDNDFNSGFRNWGILVQGSGNQVYNNVVYDLTGDADNYGLDIFGGNPVVYNNTVTGNTYGLIIENESGSLIRNNILYGNGTNYAPSAFTPTQDHNFIGTDPLFFNESGHDYRLASNSTARDGGTNTGSIATLVLVDILGTARPMGGVYDVGAYEFIASAIDTPATGTIIVTDSFTDTAGDELTAQHTGETGATWAVQAGATTGMVISSANRLRGNTPDVDTFAYASGVPLSSQYDVRIGLHTFTTIADHTYLLWARMSISERTGYFAMYNRVPGTIELWAVVTGSYNLLGSCAKTFADSSDDSLALEVRTGAQRLWYGTTLCVDAIDTSITATGRGGVGIYAPTSADTNSTGLHFDNFVVQDVSTLTPSTTCTACRYRFVR